MATTTPRIGLTKPDGTDLVDIAVLNTNFDKIDSNIASTKIQATKPSTANAGDLWWDSDTGTLYLYYVDANSSQWVAATSDPINIGVVANQTERDAQYPTPAQGMSVYRTDLGVTQRYYGLFNSSTNPGGRDTAGWYDTEKSAGLSRVSPTSVTPGGSGSSASINSLGTITYTGVTSLFVNGVFSSKFTNYLIVWENTNGSANPDVTIQWSTAGTASSANYFRSGLRVNQSGTIQNYYSAGFSDGHVIGTGENGYNGASIRGTITVFNPFTTDATVSICESYGTFTPTGFQRFVTGAGHDNTSRDGFRILSSSGTISGRFSVYGYN